MGKKIIADNVKVWTIKDIALAAVRARPGITMNEVSTITFTDVQGARQLLKDLETEGYVKSLVLECWEKIVFFPRPWCIDCGCTEAAPCFMEGKPCSWTVEPGETPSEFGAHGGICTKCQ